MPKNHDEQNMDMKIPIDTKSKKHVCMQDLHHGYPGSRVLIFIGGCGLSNGGVDGYK